MAEILAGLFILLLFLLLALHIFGLPANWIILGLVGVWRWAHPELTWGWHFLGILVVLAVFGEILEFLGQYFGAKRSGGSARGQWGAFGGAIVGGILGLPFLLGIGALLGGMAGAYAGALLAERSIERSWTDSRRAAWGAMWGKFFGLVGKLGIGVFMLALSVPRIWPN